MRKRKCDTLSPSQLDTTGFTHLFYSFAFIDPVSFKVVPAHADDEELMQEFTSLSKDGKLQTWIAICNTYNMVSFQVRSDSLDNVGDLLTHMVGQE
jgi:hypothetical protein